MASIYKRPGSKVWQCSYYASDPETGEDMPAFTIKTWLKEWKRRKAEVTAPATRQRYKASAKTFTDWLGDRADKPLESLTVADIRLFREKLTSEGRAARTAQAKTGMLGHDFGGSCQMAAAAIFVFASSFSVYGPDAPLPAEETTIPDPCSPYALTKLHGEQWGCCTQGSTSCACLPCGSSPSGDPASAPDLAMECFPPHEQRLMRRLTLDLSRVLASDRLVKLQISIRFLTPPAQAPHFLLFELGNRVEMEYE